MIPKVIYMSHKNLNDIEKYSQNWKLLNPDYEIKLYDDELCEKFLLEEYSNKHANIFNFIKHGPIKCDFWRVCVINKYGGLYVDADIEPLVPLKEYIDDDDYFVSCISTNFDNNNNQEFKFNPHFILSDKNNPILQKCIDKYIELYYNRSRNYSYHNWSICRLMTIEEITEKKSQIVYLNNKKHKFLFSYKH